MSVEKFKDSRGGSSVQGIVEIHGGPPTRSFITRLAEGIINGREPIPAIHLSELISELKRIEDGGGNLGEYIKELEGRAETENHNNGRISLAIGKIRALARHDTQVIIDGHPVGGKTTAIIVAAGGFLAVGAGIFLRIGHAPSKSRPKEEKPKLSGDPGPNPEGKVQD